jgi:hypothetical protein
MSATEEIAAIAAGLIVEEGMEYGPAKRRAAKEMGLGRQVPWPDNLQLENAVREHIALFCPETQAKELLALRQIALEWMLKLQPYRPHVVGAVWRGTATKYSAVHLHLYCDDSKSAEISLINTGMRFEVEAIQDRAGNQVDILSLLQWCVALSQPVTLYLHVLDHDAIRGALKPDALGYTSQGDLFALQKLMP